jgi:hypothetical protein
MARNGARRILGGSSTSTPSLRAENNVNESTDTELKETQSTNLLNHSIFKSKVLTSGKKGRSRQGKKEQPAAWGPSKKRSIKTLDQISAPNGESLIRL